MDCCARVLHRGLAASSRVLMHPTEDCGHKPRSTVSSETLDALSIPLRLHQVDQPCCRGVSLLGMCLSGFSIPDHAGWYCG